MFYNPKNLISFLTTWLACTICIAQSKYDQDLKYVKKIFPSKYVSDIAEDKNGYIWLATDEGVIRYNGTSSIQFTVKDGLPSNDIIYLNVDEKNRVWLTGYYDGLYYIENNTVKMAENSAKLSDVVYCYSKQDTVFFRNKYMEKSFYFIRNKLYFHKNNYNSNVQAFSYYPESKLHVGYLNYDIYINNKNIKINEEKGSKLFLFLPGLRYDVPTFVKLENSSNFPFISRIIPNWYLAYENESLHKYKIDNSLPENSTLTNFGKFEKNRYGLFLTPNNKVIVTNYGKYDDTLSAKFEALQLNFKDYYFSYIDSKNNIWLIDKNNRLNFVPGNFGDMRAIFSIASTLENSIFIKDYVNFKTSHFVLTTNNKIYYINERKQTVRLLKNYNENIVRNLIIKNDTLMANTQTSISKFIINDEGVNDCDQFVITGKKIATYENKLFHTLKNKIFDAEKQLYEIENQGDIKHITVNRNYLYVATHKNLIQIHRKTHQRTTFALSNSSSLFANEDYVVVGTQAGEVFVLDPKNLRRRYEMNFETEIMSFKFDEVPAHLYIHTKKAIFIYEKNNSGGFSFFSQINVPLPLENIVNFSYDKNHIFLSTNTSVFKIKKNVLNAPAEASLDIDQVNVIGYQKKLRNGSLVDRNENNVSFKISLKTYNSPENFNVYYQVKHDNDIANWKKIPLDDLNFYDLNPGEYTITFKVEPKHGSRKISYTSFNFSVDYYFWETLWFRIIVILICLIIITSVTISLKNRYVKKQKMTSKLITLEQKALTAQMNPHFTFNALNNIQSVMFLEGERAANKHFVNFSKLLRLTLDILNSEKISIADEIDYIKSYISVEQLNCNSEIIFTIDIDENLNTETDKIPVMLVQPIIENAIKYGQKISSPTKIQLKIIRRNDSGLMIIVQDNGPGFNSEEQTIKKKHRSYAINILKRRLSILNTLEKEAHSISIISNEDPDNHGTRVEIIIGN